MWDVSQTRDGVSLYEKWKNEKISGRLLIVLVGLAIIIGSTPLPKKALRWLGVGDDAAASTEKMTVRIESPTIDHRHTHRHDHYYHPDAAMRGGSSVTAKSDETGETPIADPVAEKLRLKRRKDEEIERRMTPSRRATDPAVQSTGH
jgi:hypothetical protein